jgi:Fur family transcriptional regulator, ferric uptake regulator
MSCFTTLQRKGFRLTRPRRVILDYIHDKGEPLTAEDVINYVHGKYPRINKSTIYRTLELLEKNGCVFTNKANEQTVYHHAEGESYYHLVCCRCGKTTDCEEVIFTTAEKAFQEKYGFQIDFKHIVISGICKNCLNLKS